MLILVAPKFYFIILQWLLFRLFTTLPSYQNETSRFRLLVRLRMALGRLRLQRLSNVELLRIRNSPSCLHSIEPSCGIGQARSLSVQMANASLEDLLYLSRASDRTSDHKTYPRREERATLETTGTIWYSRYYTV